jgi:hypothetical protein
METNPFDAAEQNPQQNPFDLAEEDPNKPKPAATTPNPIDTFIRGIVSGAASAGKGILDTYNKGSQLIRDYHLDKILPATGPMGQMISMTTDPMMTSGYTAISDHLSQSISDLDKLNEGGNPIVKKAGELTGGAFVVPPIFKSAELGGSILLDNTIAQNALGKMATIASGIGRSPVQKAIVAGIAKSLPGQIFAGVGTSGLIDPQSLTTIKGAGVAAGMGVVGSLIDGLSAGAAVKNGAKISPENVGDVDALQNAGNNGQGTSKHTVNWWNSLDPNEKILAQKVGGLENIPINELNTSEAHINKMYSDPEVRRGINELATARQAAETEAQLRSITGKPKSAAEVRSTVRPEPIDMEIPINNPASAIDELPPEASEELLGYKKGVGQQAVNQFTQNPSNASNILSPTTSNVPGANSGGRGGKPPTGFVGQAASGATPPNPNNGLPVYSSNIQSRIKVQNHSIGNSIQSLMGGIINGLKKLTPNNFRQEFINNTHNLTVVEKSNWY